MRGFALGVGAFLLALAATYVTAAAAATQAVMTSLAGMGVDVSLADRLATTLADQVGMFALFAPLLSIALGIGFAVAALVCHWLPGWRRVGYVTAGFAAVVVMHLLLRAVLDVTPVAAARTIVGLTIQGLAGALGGQVFYLVTTARRQLTGGNASNRKSAAEG